MEALGACGVPRAVLSASWSPMPYYAEDVARGPFVEDHARGFKGAEALVVVG